jgi:hypothetical protein
MKALFVFTFPFPVTLNLFAADLFDFNFGTLSSSRMKLPISASAQPS